MIRADNDLLREAERHLAEHHGSWTQVLAAIVAIGGILYAVLVLHGQI